MKIVDSNNWVPRNKSIIPMPIKVYYYNSMRLEIKIDWFYYRLESTLYNILDEDNYFNEDD